MKRVTQFVLVKNMDQVLQTALVGYSGSAKDQPQPSHRGLKATSSMSAKDQPQPSHEELQANPIG